MHVQRIYKIVTETNTSIIGIRHIQGWAKKVSQRNLHITSSNIGRFSKFLHYKIFQEICYEKVIKYPTSP